VEEMSIFPACDLRKQILGTRGLATADFATEEAAYTAADVLIKVYKDGHPEVVAMHPDICFEGMPQLDQFWYAEFKGNQHFGSFALFGFVCVVWVFMLRGHTYIYFCVFFI
jgi:hypothetical protein